MNCLCNVNHVRVLDITTPRYEDFTAFFSRSFAYHTVKNRMPVTLTQIIDGLVRKKLEIGETYGREALDDLKKVVGELSKLKYEIQTNKSLAEMESDKPDVAFYNNYLKEQLDKNVTITYFNAIWLHAECYMYRRIQNIFESTIFLKTYDPFRLQKEEAFSSASNLIISLGANLLHILNDETESKNQYDDFRKLLHLNLWGNKCDLSLSNGKSITAENTLLESVEELSNKILCDETSSVWNVVSSKDRFNTIDIILDNAGYEVFTDLCLADFLISNDYAEKIRFYVKEIPWFVSDCTLHDFEWIMKELTESDNDVLSKLGSRWKSYLQDGAWSILQFSFWTYPIEYANMYTIDENLYRKLARAKILIFKGDLNYRKLFGEINWHPTTPIEVALRGFHPTKVCTIRTLKSDIICGLDAGVAEEIERKDPNWLITGEYGVIQFCGKVVHLL